MHPGRSDPAEVGLMETDCPWAGNDSLGRCRASSRGAYRVSDGSPATMECARPPIVDTVSLTHPDRRRSMPAEVTCHSANVRTRWLAPFFNESKCPHPRCGVTPRNVLGQREQKPVDSMLVVDLVRLGQPDSELTVPASSDDAIRPGLRVVLLPNAGTCMYPSARHLSASHGLPWVLSYYNTTEAVAAWISINSSVRYERSRTIRN